MSSRVTGMWRKPIQTRRRGLGMGLMGYVLLDEGGTYLPSTRPLIFPKDFEESDINLQQPLYKEPLFLSEEHAPLQSTVSRAPNTIPGLPALAQAYLQSKVKLPQSPREKSPLFSKKPVQQPPIIMASIIVPRRTAAARPPLRRKQKFLRRLVSLADNLALGIELPTPTTEPLFQEMSAFVKAPRHPPKPPIRLNKPLPQMPIKVSKERPTLPSLPLLPRLSFPGFPAADLPSRSSIKASSHEEFLAKVFKTEIWNSDILLI